MSHENSVTEVPKNVPLIFGKSVQPMEEKLREGDALGIVSEKVILNMLKQRSRNPKSVPAHCRASAAAIHHFISGQNAKTVLVGAEYAHYFSPTPQDGRTYIVTDPDQPRVLHWTYPDGTYERDDSKRNYPHVVPGLALTICEARVKGTKQKKKHKRLAHDLHLIGTDQGASAAHLATTLIDINRVMRMTGFKTSFIYERADFPQPVKLGDSPRSPVRWLESEVVSWIDALVSKRNTKSVEANI